MSTRDAISSVAVVGCGVTALSAAASLKRRIPSLEVTLVPFPPSPAALADRMISTLPSIHGFHDDIGLTAADTIVGAESGLRLGTEFEGWAVDLPPYLHAYGAYGAPVGGASFHQLWLREHRRASLEPFDHFSPAAEFARSGGSPNPKAERLEFGLQLSLDRYGELMRAYCEHLGVRSVRGTLRKAALRSNTGFIERLLLDDGGTVSADLFIDCGGPDALLLSTLEPHFLDWRQWLPCDRIIIDEALPDAPAAVLDRVTGIAFGWRWTASSPRRSSSGVVFSSRHAPHDFASGRAVPIRQGRQENFWVRNCVVIGDAAMAIEPLEWTNLHLAHSQIDRLVSMMPGRDCAPIELKEFNRQCAAEADRVRDFVCLHYICARRPEPFWKEATAIAAPPSLAHTLSQFGERGRLPYYEEETFTRDSWLAVMLGQGFEPRHVDAMADLVPPAEALSAFAAMRQSLQSYTLPSAGPDLPELNPRGIR